jgi:hypothetical protein
VIGKREESTIINGKNKSYTVIYMREIEVGLNNCNPVLWVDDNILNSNWENKPIMENA